MSTTDFASRPRRSGNAAQAQWIKDTTHLISQLKEWASQAGWSTQVEEKALTENAVGTYSVYVLTIQAPEGRLTVEPIALRTPELDGRVDLFAYPSLTRMLLLRDTNTDKTMGTEPIWKVRTNDGLEWPLPWNHETFSQIAQGLLRVP